MTIIYNSFPLTFAFQFEFERPANPVTTDTTDDLSLQEHQSWGARVLPLPKGLRAFK
jgi:hypothetical protein